MAVLITSDNDRELYLVKRMIDTGMQNLTPHQKKEMAKKGIPERVNITFNKIKPELLDRFRKEKSEESM